MANPWTGEVALVLDGAALRPKLTLGALASLEASLEADGLVALATRFEDGSFRARDVVAVLLAGLRASGWDAPASALLDGEIEGGAIEATRVAAALLARAFVLPAGDAP